MEVSKASEVSESLSNQRVIKKPKCPTSVRRCPKANDFKDMTKHPTRGIPTARWAYHGKGGARLGNALRFERPDNAKGSRS